MSSLLLAWRQCHPARPPDESWRDAPRKREDIEAFPELEHAIAPAVVATSITICSAAALSTAPQAVKSERLAGLAVRSLADRRMDSAGGPCPSGSHVGQRSIAKRKSQFVMPE